MIKDVMTKAQARKVMMKLREANSQVFKAVDSLGVDVYGIVRIGKEEEKFWASQIKTIATLANIIKRRYHIPS